jgi:hypothetical protein
MAHIAWLRAIDMEGLGICMTQAAGQPIQGHVGYIRQSVDVIGWYAFPDVTQGAIDIGPGLMHAHTASIVRLDRKYGLHMTAFTLGL